MRINKRVHQLKITFHVTPQIERFVNIYLIEGRRCCLIDTGVAGTENIIAEYMKGLGRDITDIAAILLTHSHPDHCGAAGAIKQLSNCQVYACGGERDWIENIDRQYADRPIPNFYGLVNQSAAIDVILQDGDSLCLEDGLNLRVYETSGHSQESLSFCLIEDRILFSGDAIPVVGDIPIYISARRSMETLRKISALQGVEWYCSAWDKVQDSDSGQAAIKKALAHLEMIDREVKAVISATGSQDPNKLFEEVCERLNMKPFLVNPLFRTSILSNIENT